MRILAIDPGPAESAYTLIDADTYQPLDFDKTPNHRLRTRLAGGYEDVAADRYVIEMVASYGMPVGREVFETVLWIGRFSEAIRGNIAPFSDPALVCRRDVKLHHCGTSKANDSTIRQALVDRFTPGQRNHGKGTKAEPGFFHGFRADVWQAHALAVYAADQANGRPA